MAINNDRNLLEQQILTNSGLRGKFLEDLKAKLAKMNEQQLQAELSKSLSGDNKGEWYTGVILEHNESIIMRNNHDQTIYTDNNGNEISELKDGDDVLERTIRSTDTKGNVLETTVTFSGGRPLTQTKSKNGNTTETTTYQYNDDAEVPYVTLQTEKSDKSKVMTSVLEIDENGNFLTEDLFSRQTTTIDGTKTTLYIGENRHVIEQVEKPNGKKVATVYNVENIEDFDNKNPHRLYQQTQHNGQTHEVYYDGEGNTLTTANAGDTLEKIARRFNVDVAATKALNKKIKNLKVLQKVVVPGEHNADSKGVKGTQDPKTASRLANQAEYNRQVAKKVTEGTDAKLAAELANNGFKPTAENYGFYQRFNSLDPAQQQNVLRVIKYCKSQNITDTNKIKAKILETFPEANLFDSGKVINMDSFTHAFLNTPAFLKKKPVALETFLTETLKLDLKSDVGQRVYNELAQKSQAELNKINGQNFGDLSKTNFNEIANRFESAGIYIRTQVEQNIEQNARIQREEKLGITTKKQGANLIADVYDSAANDYSSYYHNSSQLHKVADLLFGYITGNDDAGKIRRMREMAEKLRKMADSGNINFENEFKNLLGVNYDEAKVKKILDYTQQRAQGLREIYHNTYDNKHKQFEEDFKMKYCEEAINQQILITMTSDYSNNPEFKQLCYEAFGIKGTEKTQKAIEVSATIDMFGELAAVFATMGVAEGFQAVKAANAATQAYSKSITANVTKYAGNTAGKIAGFTPIMVNSSLKMGAASYAVNLVNTGGDTNSANQAGIGGLEMGAAGAAIGATFMRGAQVLTDGGLNLLIQDAQVLSKYFKAIPKPADKTIRVVNNLFKNNTEVNAQEFMETVIQNQGPSFVAKGTGFMAEVVGFTAYNAVMQKLKNEVDPHTGKLPPEWNEIFTINYLLTHFKDEFTNLGQCKFVGQLVMFSMGAKNAQKLAIQKSLDSSKSLRNMKIRDLKGGAGYEIISHDGAKAYVSDLKEATGYCNYLMQLDMISEAMKEQPNTQWRKMKIGGEEFEVPVTKNADGTENIDFSNARKQGPDGKYVGVDGTTQKHLLASETPTEVAEVSETITRKEIPTKLENENSVLNPNRSFEITSEGSVTPEEVISAAQKAKYPGGEPLFGKATIEYFNELASMDPAFAHTLLSAIDAEGLPIIEPSDYHQICQAYKIDPAVTKELILGERTIPNYTIQDYVYAMQENPTFIKTLLGAKNSNGNYKYPLDIIKVLIQEGVCNVNKEVFDRVMIVIDNICNYLETNNINSDNVYNFGYNDYDKTFNFEVAYHPYKYSFNNKGKLKQKVNKTEQYQNVDEFSNNKNVRYQGTFSDTFGISTDLIKAEREVKDDNGQLLYKEVYQKNSVEGKYDILRIEPDGKKYKIGFTEKTPSGEIIEERNFSIDKDSQLNCVYINDSQGNRYTRTKVIDVKTNKVLFENSQKIKVINENHFESTENGIIYDIKYSKEKVVVTKENGEKFELSIGENGILDRNLLPLLKQLPGSMLEAISNCGLKRLCISYSLNANGEYQPQNNTLRINAKIVKSGSVSTLLHELGHVIDFSKKIHNDKEIRETFEEERANFERNSTYREQEIIGYFIRDSYTEGSALYEIIAEINAMVHDNKTTKSYELVDIYLHKYFPRTFSKIAKTLHSKKTSSRESDAEGSSTTLDKIAALSSHIGGVKVKRAYIAPKTDPHSDAIARKVNETVKPLRESYLNSKDNLDEIMNKNRLKELGKFESRVKKKTSLRDKIYNSFLSDIKEGQDTTMEKALDDIKDAYGSRTIIETENYAQHPEVQELLKAGDEKSAILKAAELQSQDAFDALIKIIYDIADGKVDYRITRISNYHSNGDIPYFNETQLNNIVWKAERKGLDGFDKIIKRADDGSTLLHQPSGYTAFQMNIETADGKTFEWQFRGDKVNEFAEGEHIPYDLRTGKDIVGEHKELEPLYEPLKKMLANKIDDKPNKDKIPNYAYKEYNRYLDDYYTHLRKQELGFESIEPKLSDYGKLENLLEKAKTPEEKAEIETKYSDGFKFDEKLEAKNLIKLHNIVEKLKESKITQEQALEEYNSKTKLLKL